MCYVYNHVLVIYVSLLGWLELAIQKLLVLVRIYQYLVFFINDFVFIVNFWLTKGI